MEDEVFTDIRDSRGGFIQVRRIRVPKLSTDEIGIQQTMGKRVMNAVYWNTNDTDKVIEAIKSARKII